MTPLLRRCALLVGGCVVLGVGIGMLLRADLGSDGYSSLANGITRATDLPFWICNLAVGVAFVVVAALRKVPPGVGTLVQVAVVGGTVSLFLSAFGAPDPLPVRIGLLVLALPVTAVGIATYLGSQTGAGPAEGAALAWDPPVPFKWSYTVVQGGGALVGWLLGATLGFGTLAVIVLLGPLVSWIADRLHLDVRQGRHDEPADHASTD